MTYFLLAVLLAVTQAAPRNVPAADPNKSVVVCESAPAGADPWFRAYVIFTGTYVVLTGALVGVGAAGVCYAIKTLRAIENQGRVMGEQREVMQDQLRRIGEQITEMSVQSGILKESVGVARAAAATSEKSISLVINKERARIRIVMPEKLKFAAGSFLAVEFKLLFYGTTPAYEVQSEVSCVMSESKDTWTKYIPSGIHDLPNVVSSSDIKPIYRTFLMMPLKLDDMTFEQISKKEMFVHFAGIIKYSDFMGEHRETAFHYRWNAQDNSANSLRRYIFPEGWEEIGGETENHFT